VIETEVPVFFRCPALGRRCGPLFLARPPFAMAEASRACACCFATQLVGLECVMESRILKNRSAWLTITTQCETSSLTLQYFPVVRIDGARHGRNVRHHNSRELITNKLALKLSPPKASYVRTNHLLRAMRRPPAGRRDASFGF